MKHKVLQTLQKKAGNKKLVITLLLMTFVMLVTVSGTFAYLNSITKEEENIFTLAENIRARLTEPNWDAAEGLIMVPGKRVSKDPMITNTGQIDEYVSIRLIFQYADGSDMSDTDLLKLLNLIEITWNDKWKLHDGTLAMDASGTVTAVTNPFIFYYDEVLSPGEVSEPIFDSIRVKTKSDGLTEAELRWLQAVEIVNGNIVTNPDGLGTFHIRIEGSAVQSLGFTDASGAANTLRDLFR